MTSHVETAPVVECIGDGWRLGVVGPRPQIRGRCSANPKGGSECQRGNEFRASHFSVPQFFPNDFILEKILPS